MASKTFYLLPDQSAGTSAHGSLQDGGTAPATQEDNSAWTCGTAAAGTYAEYNRNANVPQSSFSSTAQPDGVIDNVHGDCLRTQNAYTGNFASGTWTFTFVVTPNISPVGPTIALRVRLFRSTDPAGLQNVVEITTATQQSGNVAANNGADQSATIAFNPGPFALANEYLFVELALTIITASTNPSMKWNLAQRNTASIITSDWADPIVVFRRKRKPNKKRLWKKKRSLWQPSNGVAPTPQPYVFIRKKKWPAKSKGRKKRRISADWIACAPATSPPLFPFPWPRRKKRRKPPPKIKKHRPPQMISFYRQFTPALCGHSLVLSSLAARALALEQMTATTDTRVLEAIANFKKASPNRVFETLSASAMEFEALTAKATTICCN
jgi:hypothetical protein